MEHMIQVWGGFTNKGNGVPKEIKKLEGYHYFNSMEEVEEFKNKFEPYRCHGFMCNIESGDNLTHKRIVALVELEYKGKKYNIEYDFGYEYSKESARFMFFEGNYDCDCNLSLFLNRKYKYFPVLSCGRNIKLVDFKIEYRK